MSYIKVTDLTKIYNHVKVLDRVNYQFDNGNIYLITGENGCGKTTFVKLILKLIYPDGGDVDVQGDMFYIPDKFYFPMELKVCDFLKMFISGDCHQMLDEWMIDEYHNSKLKSLSKGTLHKILLVIAFNSKKDIYIFDEPLNGLDDDSKCIFISQINKLKKQDRIIIIITHFKEMFNNISTCEVSL